MTDKLPHEQALHISWDQIHRDSRALAWRLDGKGPDDGAWKAVVAIPRGGMAPAMIVARELDRQEKNRECDDGFRGSARHGNRAECGKRQGERVSDGE